MDKNTSHLSGEFLTAGELARRGLTVSITFGNAKSVDIFAESAHATYKIDAKAVRKKTNWPLSKKGVNRDTIYVFVYLGEETIMQDEPPEYFIVPGHLLIDNKLIQSWRGNRSGVTYKTLKESKFRSKWEVFR